MKNTENKVLYAILSVIVMLFIGDLVHAFVYEPKQISSNYTTTVEADSINDVTNAIECAIHNVTSRNFVIVKLNVIRHPRFPSPVGSLNDRFVVKAEGCEAKTFEKKEEK